jgi:hypothetical protein
MFSLEKSTEYSTPRREGRSKKKRIEAFGCGISNRSDTKLGVLNADIFDMVGLFIDK